MNLIVNGIDAMQNVDGTRELTITSRRVDHERVQVSVSDTGVGLPAQQADQIFKAFFTTKAQRNRHGPLHQPAPSSNRMAAGCGPKTSRHAARRSTSRCRHHRGPMNDAVARVCSEDLERDAPVRARDSTPIERLP